MTPDEKSRLIAMRKAGRSYTEIADELGISKNTVKTFCRRNRCSSSEPVPMIKGAANGLISLKKHAVCDTII